MSVHLCLITVFATMSIQALRTYTRITYECVSVCAVYNKQFILSPLHMFFIIVHAGTRTHSSASVKTPRVSLPGINRLVKQ